MYSVYKIYLDGTEGQRLKRLFSHSNREVAIMYAAVQYGAILDSFEETYSFQSLLEDIVRQPQKFMGDSYVALVKEDFLVEL